MRQLEKHVMLTVVDNAWKDHLANMDYLRQGIYLVGYAQQDPKQAFKREAFRLFSEMLDRIKAEVVQMLARIRVRSEEEVAEMEAEQQRIAARLQQQMLASGGGAPAESAFGAAQDGSDTGVATAVRRPVQLAGPKVGRNDPCPCGSGKKYKHCHGQLSLSDGRRAAVAVAGEVPAWSVGAARRALATWLRIDADVVRLCSIQLQCGELSAPHAAGVDRVHAAARRSGPRADQWPQTMRGLALAYAGHRKPRIQAGLLRARRALGIEIDPPVDVAVAHAREHVDGRALPVESVQAVRTTRRADCRTDCAAGSRVARAGQLRVRLPVRASQRLAQRPRWREAGVHHASSSVLVVMQQLLRTQPFEQHGASSANSTRAVRD